jgi:hypothetical protein
VITETLWLTVAGLLFILLALAVIKITHLQDEIKTQKFLNACQNSTIRNYQSIIKKLEEENQKCPK